MSQGGFWAAARIMCGVQACGHHVASLWRPTISHAATSSLLASNACGARKSYSSHKTDEFLDNEIIIVGVETLPLRGRVVPVEVLFQRRAASWHGQNPRHVFPEHREGGHRPLQGCGTSTFARTKTPLSCCQAARLCHCWTPVTLTTKLTEN